MKSLGGVEDKSFRGIFNNTALCAIIPLYLCLLSPLDVVGLLFLPLCPLNSKSSAIKESNNSILQCSRCHCVAVMRPHLAALSTATLQRHSVHHLGRQRGGTLTEGPLTCSVLRNYMRLTGLSADAKKTFFTLMFEQVSIYCTYRNIQY